MMMMIMTMTMNTMQAGRCENSGASAKCATTSDI